MYDLLVELITESWQVLCQMAPYLLLGFFVAGVLSVCISPAWVERHLGRRGFGPVFAASLFGVPLPLCSCGVIPVAASIRRHGASRAATTAFLLSTPQTGVDSIAVTYALLGPVFAIFRPVAALLTGVIGGLLVQFFGESDDSDQGDVPTPDTCSEACCQDRHQRSVATRVLRYAFVILPRDIGLALLVGILIAGAMAVFVPRDQLHAYFGGGILSILLMMAAGVPVYVCATASVPIAAGFMHMGASPGAALAFLIAGPATNAAAIVTIWKVLGRRTAIVYLLTVAISAIGCGLLLDQLITTVKLAQQAGDHVHTSAGGNWIEYVSAIVLLAMLALSYRLNGGHGTHEETDSHQDADATGNRVELAVSGMRCSHCADSIARSLGECHGVSNTNVDLATGRVIVTGTDLDAERLAGTVRELGYSVGEMHPPEPVEPPGNNE